jgi:hypothetical protein
MKFMIPDWLVREIQYKWERLEVRKWINANPRIVVSIAGAAVLLLLVTLGLLMSGNPPVKVEEYQKGWYYDSNSGRLFVARMDKPPPIQAPSVPSADSQPVAVKAYVFTYADEPNQAERFIGFLVMPDPNASLSSDISHLSGVRRWGHGKLIRRPTDDEWVPADSQEGNAILKGLLFPDESGKIARYYPAE